MSDLPLRTRALAALIAFICRGLRATWRVVLTNGEVLDDALAHGPVVFAFWHGDQLPLAAVHADRRFVGMASQSRDGALLAGVIARLGYRVVRGSSSRGGAAAVRQAVTLARSGASMALAVDGPRGPRHHPQEGAAAIAALTPCPIICVTCEARPALRLRSWDRFCVPAPFARLTVRYSRLSPAGKDRASIAATTQEMATRMRSQDASDGAKGDRRC